MRDGDIDDILKRSAGAKPDVDPALLARVSQSLGATLQPVRPLPSSGILACGLFLICAVVAIAGAMLLGPHGVRKMSTVMIGLIFPVLGLLIGLGAAMCVAEMIPGSRRPAAPWVLGVGSCGALIAVFGGLFHDYGTERFVAQGMTCLTAGLALAIPVAIGAWWLLSRGFAVNPVAAGWAKGALAGLAGVTMLELHCANFEAPHVMVWHIAVIPVSGALGAMVGRMSTLSRNPAGTR